MAAHADAPTLNPCLLASMHTTARPHPADARPVLACLHAGQRHPPDPAGHPRRQAHAHASAALTGVAQVRGVTSRGEDKQRTWKGGERDGHVSWMRWRPPCISACHVVTAALPAPPLPTDMLCPVLLTQVCLCIWGIPELCNGSGGWNCTRPWFACAAGSVGLAGAPC